MCDAAAIRIIINLKIRIRIVRQLEDAFQKGL